MSRKERLKPLTEEDIAACKPESLWLETGRCPLPAHVVLWSIVALLAAGLVWACVAKVDRIVAAEGRLTTVRPDVMLKPLERVTVERVLVRVGQVVEEGQELVRFDTTVNEAELCSLQGQYDRLRAQFLRLKAESERRESFELPAELEACEAGRLQRELWQARRAFFEGKTAWFRENRLRYASVASSVRNSLDKYDEMMKPMRSIEHAYARLSEQGATSRIDVFQVQIQRMGNEIEIENQRAHLIENQRLEQSAECELLAFEQEWFKDVADELASVEGRMAELREKVREAAHLASMKCLRSPCRAVVHEIAPFQEGSAVREAESFMTLVPLDVELEAQADVSAQDVGLLRLGDKARVKLEAFPFQRYGMLEGRVAFISANTYESAANAEENPNPLQNGGRRDQYRVNMSLSGALGHVPDALWRRSGMKLRAEICVGERRVISYLLDPFLKAMDESIREP